MIIPGIPADTRCVVRHCNERDEFYREVWGEHVPHGYRKTGRKTPGHTVEQLVQTVAERAGIVAGSRVCDVGRGYGRTLRLLAAVHGAEVTGVTISEAQFKFACEQKAGKDNPRFLLRPWEKNEFAAESFDSRAMQFGAFQISRAGTSDLSDKNTEATAHQPLQGATK